MQILSAEKTRRPMRVLSRALFLLCGFVLMSVTHAAAAQECNEGNRDYYVDVTNATGYTIYYLHVSPADVKTWGPDLLGDDVLPDGAESRVYICNYSSPIFDIQVEDEDGDTYTFYAIDVSRQDLTVTLSDLD
jgi:hypothetical protein